MTAAGILLEGRTAHGVWLTDPTVPRAEPVWARRGTRFGGRTIAAWRTLQDTMWWDSGSNLVYLARRRRITDFSSTPVGDGARGVMRGAGCLHDLMDAHTPVLRPSSEQAVLELEHLTTERSNTPGGWLTPEEVIGCGFVLSTESVSIWRSGNLYYRMLVSAGFSAARAYTQVFFLRVVGVQHLFRWVTRGKALRYLAPRLTGA